MQRQGSTALGSYVIKLIFMREWNFQRLLWWVDKYVFPWFFHMRAAVKHITSSWFMLSTQNDTEQGLEYQMDLLEIRNSETKMEQMDLKAGSGHWASGLSWCVLAPGSEKQIFIFVPKKSGAWCQSSPWSNQDLSCEKPGSWSYAKMTDKCLNKCLKGRTCSFKKGFLSKQR